MTEPPPPLHKCPHCAADVDGIEDAHPSEWYVCLSCERLSMVTLTTQAGATPTKTLRKVYRHELEDASPHQQRAVIQSIAVVRRMKQGPFQ